LLAIFDQQDIRLWLCVWSYYYTSWLFSCAELNIFDASVDSLLTVLVCKKFT